MPKLIDKTALTALCKKIVTTINNTSILEIEVDDLLGICGSAMTAVVPNLASRLSRATTLRLSQGTISVSFTISFLDLEGAAIISGFNPAAGIYGFYGCAFDPNSDTIEIDFANSAISEK